jgi:class 3 adenylate cyclase/predicted ATPase
MRHMQAETDQSSLPLSERRYLTIAFIDLVDSTGLSEQYDPEDVRVLLRRFQNLASRIMERFGGFVAHLTGDGILVYFGYPSAHENDAERAIRAALELIERLPQLATTLEDRAMPQLAARVGIHSGLVLVGPELLASGTTEHSVVGEAVNIAARLQSIAPPGSIVTSSDTLELVGAQFECESLGERSLKGLSRKLPVYRVLRAIPGAKRSAGRLMRGAARLVGRETAMERILLRWQEAHEQRRCRVVEVIGDAGLGKTRLVHELLSRPEFAGATIVQAACHEMFSNTPLYPVGSYLWARAGLTVDDEEALRLKKIATLLDELRLNDPENLDIAASLVGIVAGSALDATAPTPLLVKRRQYEFVISLLRRAAHAQPTIVWCDDAHWLDPSSAELLLEIVTALKNEPFMVLLTRRSFPAGAELPKADEVVSLTQLGRSESVEIARSIPGAHMLADSAIARAVNAAEGVPLFIEQFIISLIESKRHARASGMQQNGVPLVLAEMISERLDRRPGARRVMRAAACMGRSFTPDFLAELLGEDHTNVVAPLQALVEGEILYPKRFGAEIRYEFRHALLQRVAYESVMQTERRAMHARIASLLEDHDELGPPHPELIAHHLTEAARYPDAVKAWLLAGTTAARRSAHVEAIDHLRRGLDLLNKLPDPSQRRDLELKLQASLMGSIMATEGATSIHVSECCKRGLRLCQEGEPSPLVFPFAFGQFTFSNCQGRTEEAESLARLFLSLAERSQNPSARVIGHRMLGTVLFGRGDAPGAREHLELSLRLYDPERDAATTHMFGQNTEVHTKSSLSLLLFCLGEIDRSLALGISALRSADALRHPHSTAIPLAYVGGWVFGLCGATDYLMTEAKRLISVAEQHRLSAFRALGMAHLGWALCQKGHLEQGAASLEQAIALLDSIEFRMSISGYLGLWADALRRLGELDAAQRASARALKLAQASSNVWLEPELRRIEALIVAETAPEARGKAEEMLLGAAACARALGFPTLERRCLLTLKQDLGADDPRVDARLSELPVPHDLARRVATAMQA